MNISAFRWGRHAAADPNAVDRLTATPPAMVSDARRLSLTLDEMVARRAAFLESYQNAAYAARYREWAAKAKAAEAAKTPRKTGLADAVARNLFKLMAYKDEYEVARLFSNGDFQRQVASEFDGPHLRFEFHLAPPLLARRDPVTGAPRKISVGAWMLPVFKLLVRLKFLRGTAFDIFGYTAERRMERKLLADYEATLAELLGALTPQNHHLAAGIAAIPEKIRGFGHVKRRHVDVAKADEAALIEQFRAGSAQFLSAAE
jgi:indolepyruvate ferredoxin oxidoreductase